MLDVRDFSISAPSGWSAPADASIEEGYERHAEPILQQLIATPPPVLSYVRSVRAVTSPDGRNIGVAASQLIAGDAEQTVLALRREADVAAWAPQDAVGVQSVLSLEADRVEHQPATRFRVELTDGTLVHGVAFALPDRPDALGTVVFVVGAPASFDPAVELRSSLDSIRIGSRERETPAAPDGGDTLRDTMRAIWSPARASNSLVWLQRVAAMALIFCAIFASLLKLAVVFVRRRREKAGADDTSERFHSEAFLLPIAFVSVTLTALIVLWLMGA